jgi:hypothetical protein
MDARAIGAKIDAGCSNHDFKAILAGRTFENLVLIKMRSLPLKKLGFEGIQGAFQ